LTQTRRHSYIVSLLGIRHVILAVNKMDTVGYARETFDSIVADYRDFAARIGLEDIVAIPLSALRGDNVTGPSANTPWYGGPVRVAALEAIDAEEVLQQKPFRLPVQWINRPDQHFRGLAGTIASGCVRPGDPVRVLPSGRQTEVARIVTREGDLPEAVAGQSVMLTLADELDVSRGDMLAGAQDLPGIADQFQVTMIWMHEEPMLPGRPYAMKIGPATLTASISTLRHKVNVNTLEHTAAKQLELNEIGLCNLTTDRPIPFDAYEDNRETGGFVLIDKLTNDTVGAGLINFALRRSENVHWQALDVGKRVRAALKGQRSCVVWLTGLSGAGKSTIANLVEKRLLSMGRHTYTLDGDNVRHGLNRDLGFTEADRVENIRRVAEVSKLMVDAGLIVLVSFISPFRSERRMARELLEAGEFMEVYVDTPLDEAERRDTKGLYRKARLGQIKNFTGIDSPYEPPENPDLTLDTSALSAEQAADLVIGRLVEQGLLDG
jgi:bifunctional enzyme CysN/CysC